MEASKTPQNANLLGLLPRLDGLEQGTSKALCLLRFMVLESIGVCDTVVSLPIACQ